jgi:molybdenum cofactor synthesis domain-containing protein
MLVIGDEILSGRTRDRNIGHLAAVLTLAGIDLREARVVGDDQADIVAAVNALRARYTYVFTSGGIGPTHDDITADAIAAAFGVAIGHDPATLKLLGDNYAARGIEFNEARRRMARLPQGAGPIANPVSLAPGFRLGNVFVMAGVPAIFEAMLDNAVPMLKGGLPMLSETVHCPLGEGAIGGPLGEIQKANPQTVIGSYPKFADGRFWTELVVRSRDAAILAAVKAEVEAMVARLMTNPR